MSNLFRQLKEKELENEQLKERINQLEKVKEYLNKHNESLILENLSLKNKGGNKTMKTRYVYRHPADENTYFAIENEDKQFKAATLIEIMEDNWLDESDLGVRYILRDATIEIKENKRK